MGNTIYTSDQIQERIARIKKLHAEALKLVESTSAYLDTLNASIDNAPTPEIIVPDEKVVVEPVKTNIETVAAAADDINIDAILNNINFDSKEPTF